MSTSVSDKCFQEGRIRRICHVIAASERRDIPIVGLLSTIVRDPPQPGDVLFWTKADAVTLSSRNCV
jgi:hypothetical protein